MINVYSTELTPRIEYACRLIFETIMGDVVEFYTEKQNYLDSAGPKINYSAEPGLEGLMVEPKGLLSENHVQYFGIDIFEWEGEKAFFQTNGTGLPFDLFAAAFFLVTRYEEYLPGKRDRHKRFMARKSAAVQHHFLEKPLINIWALKLAGIIENQNEGYRFKRPKFKYLPTIDIDNAWAFKNKNFFRVLASSGKDVLHGRWHLLRKRMAVVIMKGKDPYDNYDFISETLKAANFRPVFFFLLNNQGKRDRSLSHKNPFYRALIRQCGKTGKIGIHPSYNSNKNTKQLKKEINRLKDIVKRKVKRSRQHYLVLSMPKTYRRLIESDIKADYSMGYPTRPGFRASICTPFYFFDVLENEITKLKIYPFEVMDVTLHNYRNLRATDAVRKIKTLMQATAAVGGTFISLWHNESLSGEGHWKEWREVYTEMTNMAVELRDGQKN